MRRALVPWGLVLMGIAVGGATAAPRVLDRIAAVVNGEPVLLSEVDRVAQPALDRLPPGVPPGEREIREREIRQRALDSLIDELLFNQLAREHKISVADEELDREIQRVLELNHINQQQLVEMLRLHEHKSLEQFREERRRDMVQQKLLDSQLIKNPEMKGRLQVGERDVEEAYRAQYASATAAEAVRVSHILLMLPSDAPPEREAEVRGQAERLASEIRQGLDFAEAARAHSQDPSAALGGDLGFIRRGEVEPAFEKAAFALRPGEVSGPVRTPFGIHLIRVTERKVEGARPFEEVQNEIRNRLAREKFMKVMQDWLAELRQRATIDNKL